MTSRPNDLEAADLVKTNCRFCGYQCGLLADVKNGKVKSVRPDPTQYPGDESIQRGCSRWRLAPQFIDHPERINYPLKRVGERGSGQWQRVSWDEALGEIAQKLESLKNRYGPEMLATCIGGPHAIYWPLHRFMNLFGSPNNMGIGQICWNPGTWINTVLFGWPIESELDPAKTNCLVVWGMNPAESDNSLLWREMIHFSQTGKPFIVVDPRKTRAAQLAQLWLPVRPGTDAVLALGLLHVIIKEKLYDHDFVANWCHGFAELENHVAAYTPVMVAEKTGVAIDLIVKAARLYAKSGPAAIFSGRGIDQIGCNSVPTHHGLALLKAVTGNVDRDGASHIHEMPDFIPELDLELSENLPDSVRQKQLNSFLLQSYKGYDRVRELTMRQNKRLPLRYLTSAQPNLVWNAIITGKPYPIRSLVVMATNPLLTQADTHLVYQALKKLDLLVCLELFQTPTAMLADFILPSAGALERPLFETKAGTANIAYGGQKAVAPYYERRTDYAFWRELGLRLGQEGHWPWASLEDTLEEILAPTGFTWQDFCESGLYYPEEDHRKYERIDTKTSKPVGFATITGKVELYSELLREIGGDPLPKVRLGRDKAKFPLQLITGARFQPYYASSFRQFDALRKLHPTPLIEMSPTTAEHLGVSDGIPVWVETERGKARFVVKVTTMCDGVVSVEYGWWYPEMAKAEPTLSGLWIANANILTHADAEAADPLTGTSVYNGIPCRVWSVD